MNHSAEYETLLGLGYSFVVRYYDLSPVAWGILLSDLIPVAESQVVPANYHIYSVKSETIVWGSI
jgi:hypothetical protein